MSNKKISFNIFALIKTVCIVLLVFFSAVGLISGSKARYISFFEQTATLVSSQFYFESDYLTENDNTQYNITLNNDPNSTFDINIYNYINNEQLTENNIIYSVNVENGSFWIYQGDNEVSSNNDQFTMYQRNELVTHTLRIQPNDSQQVRITVESQSPYTKTLKAEFNITRE